MPVLELEALLKNALEVGFAVLSAIVLSDVLRLEVVHIASCIPGPSNPASSNVVTFRLLHLASSSERVPLPWKSLRPFKAFCMSIAAEPKFENI